ncbi:MAG TPA: sigma factor-like helix-turn-helix DNA-binding protein, partial [Kofleriaceae bacterium]
DVVTPIDATDEPAWGRVTIEDVRAALEHLDPTFATVYRMHAFEHRSYEQIASALKIERITVGTRLNRARKMLRQVLVKRLGLEEAL